MIKAINNIIFFLIVYLLSSIGSITLAFESIKQRLEKNSISQHVKTIELWPNESEDIQNKQTFFSDSQFLIHSRTYLFDHDRESDPSSNRINNNRYSVATGGWINFKSGYYNNWLGVGLTQYGSYKLDGSQREDGAQLLRPEQRDINVLGEAYVEVLHPFGNLKIYRQKINTPFMNTNDSRMLPQTFEAIKLSSRKDSKVEYIIAYADKMKSRDHQTFKDINDAVNNDEGVWLAGIRHRFNHLLRAGLISYHAEDYLNIHYAELDGTHQFSTQSNLFYALQYIVQNSIGKDYGDDINTDAYGLRFVYSMSDWQWFFNYTDVDNNHTILSPWGGYAGYNSVQINDFNRAGEEAIGLGVGYSFSSFGLKGLTATVKYINGDTPDNGQIASSDQTEINYDLQYVFQSGALEGVSTRLRYADVNRKSYTSDSLGKLSGLGEEQLRIIINYEIQL